MKAYSIEFRQKIVKAYSQGNTSIRKVAARFYLSKSFVQKLLKQQKVAGHLHPKKTGVRERSELAQAVHELTLMVTLYPDAT
jgi:transposase